jgi:PIN domain nuclease of toxin-antitoxin system
MNPILLDTHTLIWLIEGNPRLSQTARREIQAAANQNNLLISAITPWEIGLLVSKKRIDLHTDALSWTNRVLGYPGVHLVPLFPAIAIASSNLPFEMHADPADRILVATARHLGATLITADELLLRHGAEGRFRCLSAI